MCVFLMEQKAGVQDAGVLLRKHVNGGSFLLIIVKRLSERFLYDLRYYLMLMIMISIGSYFSPKKNLRNSYYL